MGQYKDYLLLHFIVIILGFTAILGKLISVSAEEIVWFRMSIAFFGIFIYMLLARINIITSKANTGKFLATGLIVAAHWITFFLSIKLANVAIALVCFSSTAFFTALLEPLIFRRKIIVYELLFGAVVVVGLAFIFSFEIQYIEGIVYGIISAFLASLFTVINGVFIQKNSSMLISLYEMLGGVIGVSTFFLIRGDFSTNMFVLSTADWGWLLLLGLVCTTFAFAASVYVMRALSPFTVSLTINLEPVYGILLALLIFGDSEKMTPGFYVGGALLLLVVLSNAYLKKKQKQKRPSQ